MYHLLNSGPALAGMTESLLTSAPRQQVQKRMQVFIAGCALCDDSWGSERVHGHWHVRQTSLALARRNPDLADERHAALDARDESPFGLCAKSRLGWTVVASSCHDIRVLLRYDTKMTMLLRITSS